MHDEGPLPPLWYVIIKYFWLQLFLTTTPIQPKHKTYITPAQRGTSQTQNLDCEIF